MSADSESQMSQIMKIGVGTRRAFKLFMFVYALSLLAWLMIIAFAPASANWGIRVGSHDSIWSLTFLSANTGDIHTRRVVIEHIVGTQTKILLCLIVLLYHAWLLKFFYHGFKLFNNYARGDIFGKDNILQIRRLGVNTQLGFLVHFLPPLFVYLLREAGEQPWLPDVGIGAGTVFPLVAGWAIVFVARVMEVGRELREEKHALEAERALVI